ncbi:MAG: DUF262 domain-containing protein [Mycoplasmatales bacterium]|nr:DUF262 domain-containing protein [Mycoplasmatales bacterium]
MMRLTKNFNFIQGKPGSENIIEEILKVEKRIIEKDWEVVPLKVRNITENILRHKYSMEGSFAIMVATYKERYGEPTVIDALHHIRALGNKYSHNLPNEIKRKIDMVDILYLIKSLSIVCQDAFQETQEQFIFNESAYFKMESDEKPNNVVTNIRNKELNIKKTSLISWFTSPNVVFKIPFYQRRYTWSEHNVKTLIKDVEARIEDRNQHYFGVVAVSKSINSDNQVILKIIDGQQRITTSLLLLRVAYNLLLKSDINRNKYPQKLIKIFQNLNIVTRYLNEAAEKPELNEFINIMQDNILDEFKTTYYKNYLLMERMMNSFSDSKLLDFINIFIEKFEIADLEYRVESKREMDIFENMNSKGSNLEEWDLIKNQIFNFVEDGVMKDLEKVRMMRRYFESEFSLNLKDPNDKINDFFKELCYLSFIKKGKEYETEYDRFKVYNNFKVLFKDISFKKEHDYLNFLKNDIQKYAIIHKALLMKKIDDLDSDLAYLQKRISNITSKESTFFLMMALVEACFKWVGDSWQIVKKKEFERSIILLDSLFIRREVTEGFGHSFRNKLIKIVKLIASDFDKSPVESISKVIYEEDSKGEILMPSDSVFKEKLIAPYTFHKKNSLATKVLLQLELYILDRLGTNSYNLNLKNPSLEHIMPRTNDEWLKELKKQIKKGEVVEEEFQKHLNMIGNFLVVPRPINSSMKKAPFLKKKTKITQFNVPLIKGDIDLGIVSFDYFQEWTFEIIRERTKVLSLIILKEVYPFKI